MKQVVAVKPILFCCAVGGLAYDFELALSAFAHSADVVHTWLSKPWMREEADAVTDDREFAVQWLRSFQNRLQETLELHHVFMTTTLIGISQTRDSGSSLAVLNQGSVTSTIYKRRIADYLDIPTGKRLRTLRRAAENIEVAFRLMQQRWPSNSMIMYAW